MALIGSRRALLRRRPIVASGGGGTARSIVTASTPKQYLTTTWGNTPTDATKATISYWINYNILSVADSYLFTTAFSAPVLFDHKYDGSSFLFSVKDDISNLYQVTGTGFAADTGTWHQVCVAIDTNQATSTNRVRMYVDGVELSYGTQTEPLLGTDMKVTANGVASYIGEVSYQIGNTTGIPDAKFAYFYLIDGQALTPSSFTTGTGVGSIHPITYAGTYGANGFFLNGNGGSLTDAGPNGIVWTAPNGITFSSDVPT